MQTTEKPNVSFILVRPESLGNIGSIARILKNFGFSDLRLVGAPRTYKDAEARKMAVGAFDVLKASSIFTNLPEAINNLHCVIGTTSGHQRNQPAQSLVEALESAPLSGPSANIGIIFGDERNGLRAEELDLCNIVATIPSDREFPSLNLAQAACVVAYELSRLLVGISTEPQSVQLIDRLDLPSVGETDELFLQLATLLETVQFSRAYNKKQVLLELRHFYQRASPSKRESDLLRGILHKLNHVLSANAIVTNDQ
jgi:TrmH family RNA methyltransferase